MLKDFGSLSECEKLLNPLLQQISLIGQLSLTEEDIDKLAKLIRDKIETDIKYGTWELKKLFPTCLACFLVFKGHEEYKSGDFWSSVWESLNLPKSTKWQGEWGEVFIEFLKENKLPSFDIGGGHRYVTPILVHGGIPNYCLNDFFQNLLVPIVLGQLEVDITNTDEIIKEWRYSSLFDLTDKPVQRFLCHGQEVAKDFLDRCIEMARRAYEAYEGNETLSFNEFDLPENVIRKFQEWWDSYQDKKQIPKEVLYFRRPIVILDVGLEEIQVKIPPQKVDKSELKEASVEILIEGN
jgi:hypothetical protein